LPETIIPNSVLRRVKDGPVPGVVPHIEMRPNGDHVIGLAPPTMTPDGRFTGAESKPVTHTFTGGPAEVRRHARVRYQELLRRLWSDANLHFYKDGEIRWPKSIEDEIAVLGIAQGKPNLAAQVESLARRFIERGAREQQAQDQKRITADWHGHLSA
jgi:hypothetical protein